MLQAAGRSITTIVIALRVTHPSEYDAIHKYFTPLHHETSRLSMRSKVMIELCFLGQMRTGDNTSDVHILRLVADIWGKIEAKHG